MRDLFVRRLRVFAASLITLSGFGHVTAMWYRPLDTAAVMDLVLGASYLIIGIGLFGQSRFTLLMAMVIPAGAASYATGIFPEGGLIYSSRQAVDAVVIFSSAVLLWRIQLQRGFQGHQPN